MAVRANLIVGAIGAILALGSGSFIALNFESLVGLETWQATFDASNVRLTDRAASLGSGAVRNEVHDIRNANVTRMNVDLTWTDPPFNSPEITLRVLDPEKRVRGEESHTGGASGIHLEIILIEVDEAPEGIETFRVREDPQDLNARNAFETRWPTRDEMVGNWTFEIRSTPRSGPTPSGNIAYTLSARYEFFEGTFSKIPESAK